MNSKGVKKIGDLNIAFDYKKESKEFVYEVGKISMKDKTIIFNKI